MILDINNVTYYMEIGQNIHDFKIQKSMQNVQINLWKKGRWGKKIENKFLGYNSTQNYWP